MAKRETFEGIVVHVNKTSTKVTRISLEEQATKRITEILYFPPEATPCPDIIKDKMVPLFLKGGTVHATCTLMGDGSSWAIKEVSVRAPDIVQNKAHAKSWCEALVYWMAYLKDLRAASKDNDKMTATKLGVFFKGHQTSLRRLLLDAIETRLLQLQSIFTSQFNEKGENKEDVITALIAVITPHAQSSILAAHTLHVLRRVKEVYEKSGRFHKLMADVRELGHKIRNKGASLPTEPEVAKLVTVCDNYVEFRTNPFAAFMRKKTEGERARVNFTLLDTFAEMYDIPVELRITYNVVEHMSKIMESEGHTYSPITPICATVATRMLCVTASDVKAVIEANKHGEFHVETIRDTEVLYLKYVYKMECDLAERIRVLVESSLECLECLEGEAEDTKDVERKTRISQLVSEFEEIKGLKLHTLQRASIEALFTGPESGVNGIHVLTGNPGTGKSSVVQCIWFIADALRLGVITCAPTGKAANRLGPEAMTIHRTLKYTMGGFEHNEDKPIQADVLIVDEVSMLDLNIAHCLFNALPIHTKKTRVLLIGDENQLPSVSYGDTLRSILGSQVVPHTHLTKIFRQGEGSIISKLGRCIIKGNVPDPAYFQGEDVTFHCLSDPLKIHRLVLRLYKENQNASNAFQILVPTKKGEVGTQALNSTIHRYLYKDENLIYQRGERIMVVTNSYAKDQDGTIIQEESVFNGESGEFIESVRDGKVRICVEEKDVVVDRDAIDFGYAITVNKAQGSEYETVVMVLHDSHSIMLNREVFYTGVTRAKKRLHIIGTEACMARAIKYRCPPRFTALASRIAEGFEIESL